MSGPLARASSLKVKLGALVGVSVLAATLIATLGTRSRVTPWLVVPVTIAVALGITQWLAAGMTAPLRAMTAAAGRMSQGDYSTQIAPTGNDEVAALARAFTAMAADLRDTDQHHRELVATISHELRTPAAALRAVLENMADGVTPADDGAIGSALRQAERLSDLLTDLLALSRLDAGIAELSVQTVRVADLLAESVSEFAAGGCPLSTTITVEPPDLRVRAEPVRLRQAVTNLVDNAARHTPSGTTVSLSATTSEPGLWQLDVCDEGPGIALGDRERIFERFGTASAGGTGLGLAITRWVAQIHGGTIAAIDPGPGRVGARLRLTLPLEPPRRPHAHLRDAHGLNTPNSPDEAASSAVPHNPGVTMTPAPSQPPAEAPSAAAGGRRTEPIDATGLGATAVASSGSRGPRRGSGAGGRASDVMGPPSIDALFDRIWPESDPSGRPRLVLVAACAGALAALLLPQRSVGLAWSLILVAAGAAILVSARRVTWLTGTVAVLGLGLATLATLRAGDWLMPLAMLSGGALLVVALVPVYSVSGLVAATLSWPLAGLRGLPWLGRSLSRRGHAARWWSVIRTALLSGLALVVFGSLFASADAIFGHWMAVVVPDLTIDGFISRAFVWVAVGGVTLAGMYLAVNPIRHDMLGLPPRPPVAHTWEWLVPVGLVVSTYAAFIAAQASAWLGGHDYVQRATGLTYAQYVHQGFGQLTVATLLTLVVVALTVRVAARTDPGHRLLLRAVLGALCLLTLAVVASALWRMHLYQQAFGYTTLRLLVDFFEVWVAAVVVMVLVAGISFSGRWIPTAAVVAGASLILAFGLMNPDAWVAERNLQQYAESGRIDGAYLSSLSADAAPAIAGSALSTTDKDCILGMGPASQLTGDDPLEWNLGRARARDAIAGMQPTPPDRSCTLPDTSSD